MHLTSHGGAQWHQRASSESLCLATTRPLSSPQNLYGVLLQCLLVSLVPRTVIVQTAIYTDPIVNGL